MKLRIGNLREIIRSVLKEVNFPGRPTGHGVEPFSQRDLEMLANMGFPPVDPLDDDEERMNETDDEVGSR